MDKSNFDVKLDDHAARIKDSYFNWLIEKVCDNDIYSFDGFVSHYVKLLEELHSVEFFSIISNDGNRAMDGIVLRDRFAYDFNIDDYSCLNKKCSFLEMLVALAIRCESDIMTQSVDYDRTATWFWLMMKNCGLYNYTDKRFDIDAVHDILDRILNRTYFEDGTGGLFRVSDLSIVEEFGMVPDFRKLELWYQLSFWLQENFYSIDDDEASENIVLG